MKFKSQEFKVNPLVPTRTLKDVNSGLVYMSLTPLGIKIGKYNLVHKQMETCASPNAH